MNAVSRNDTDRNTLALQWTGMVPWILRRLRHNAAVRRYRDECQSAGFLGLLRAAACWDETRGAKFNTLAFIYIRSAVLKEATRNARQSGVLFRDLAHDDKDFPFDLPARAAPAESPELDKERLATALARLRPRLARVLVMRYGLDQQGERTLEAAGAELGVGKERVRQIEALALRRMARELGRLEQLAEGCIARLDSCDHPREADAAPAEVMSPAAPEVGADHNLSKPSGDAAHSTSALRGKLPDYTSLAETVHRWAVRAGVEVDNLSLSYQGRLVLLLPLLANEAPATEAPPPDEDAQAERGPCISPIVLDILRVLREAGQPLTGMRLMEELASRDIEWSKTSVEHYLASMVKDGTLENPPDARPRGYRFPESASIPVESYKPAPSLGDKGRPVSRVALDILKVIEEEGRPLTTTRLLEAMAKRGMEWSHRAVADHLVRMVEDGTLENPTGVKPRGYRFPLCEATQ